MEEQGKWERSLRSLSQVPDALVGFPLIWNGVVQMIRFGIVGAGNIAHRFAASLAHETRARLVAVSCRTEKKAQSFLDEVGCAQDVRAYGGHEALLQDDEVDAIYLALPHAFHHEWALRALRAGKAVLCEKPAMLTALQMEEVANMAHDKNVLFMEAMKPRFVPLYSHVVEAVREIGPLSHVDATLCNDMLDAVEGSGTYHMTPGPGSGVLLDCGTYCASWIEAFCPQGLGLVSVDSNVVDGVDAYVDARLGLGDMTARLECAFDRAKPRVATLVGAHGRIVVEELHRPTRATVLVGGQAERVLEVPYEVDDFFGEIHHFVDLLEQGVTESPIMSLEDSVNCAAVLDAIRAGLAS